VFTIDTDTGDAAAGLTGRNPAFRAGGTTSIG
jgi:hypothetical protein